MKLLFPRLLFAASAIALSGCGSTEELPATLAPHPITVDGDNADWAGIPSHIEKNIAVSVCNDDRNLYLCLTSQNRQTQMQFMMLGFTVWFDRNGGDDRIFGIHFPIGFQQGSFPHRGGIENDGDEPREFAASELNEMEILGPGKDDKYRVSVASGSGIEVKLVRNRRGLMVYEMRVPLEKTQDHPYALGSPGAKGIGIGFETGELDRQAMRQNLEERGGGERRGGMRGGGFGSRRGEGGGRPEGASGRERPDPVKMWFVTTLAPAGK